MLAPLADPSDLADRNITIPSGMDVDAVLRSVSDAIRDAAGCSITYGPSTITLVVDDPCGFDLPAGPVSSVASVTVAGVPIVGWAKVGDTVSLPIGWQSLMPTGWVRCIPFEVVVTYTHGYPVVPADIVDLACAMASMALAASGSYGTGGRTTLIKLGDYEERFNLPAGTESPSPVAVPDAVRNKLRARFGTSAVLMRVA